MKTLRQVSFLVFGIFIFISMTAGCKKKQEKEKHNSMVQWNSWLGPQSVVRDIVPEFNLDNYDVSVKVVLGKNINICQDFLLLVCRNGKLMYLDKKQIKSLKPQPEKKYIYCTVRSRAITDAIGIFKLKITSGPLKNAIVSVLNYKLCNSLNQALYAIPDNIDIKLGELSFCLFQVIDQKISGIDLTLPPEGPEGISIKKDTPSIPLPRL